jgi:hypothetical protein
MVTHDAFVAQHALSRRLPRLYLSAVRIPTLVVALALVACGRSDGRDSAAEPGPSSAAANRGPDPIVLRVPREGGRVSAYEYPKLDSVIWRSSQAAPSLARVLGFDVEGGLLAAVDGRGLPTRIDLRMGTVSTASRTPFASLTSSDGIAIYGVAANGSIARLTPSGGEWKHTLPARAQDVFAQTDGSLLVVAARGAGTVLWQLRPPETRLLDSASVDGRGRALGTAVGDRVYFAVGSELRGVRTRGLEPVPGLTFERPVSAVAATPSGDRLYVATEGTSALSVVDRYSDEIDATITLPGAASDLRVDPLGRYVLARFARGDSAWVIAVENDRLVGAVGTAWRADLPFVAPDGAIALARGGDVHFVSGATLAPVRTVAGGASDFWHVILWNGFRPRAAGLDAPVSFGGGRPRDSVSADSADTLAVDSSAAVRDSVPTTPPETTSVARGAVTGQFNVSFAAVATEQLARETAVRIRVGGETPRVVPTDRGGTTLFRVVMGPYPTYAEAERIGRLSGRQFWIYEGAP